MSYIDVKYKLNDIVFAVADECSTSFIRCGKGEVTEIRIINCSDISYYVDPIGWFRDSEMFTSINEFQNKVVEYVEKKASEIEKQRIRCKTESDELTKPRIMNQSPF